MMKQKVKGPYKVINIGVGGDVYEVVEMLDEEKRLHAELRPRYTSTSRQAAYGKCLRLNKRWQDEHANDAFLDDLQEQELYVEWAGDYEGTEGE